MRHVIWAIVVAVLVLLAGASGVLAAAGRPNVIIVLVDDMGYGDLSCHGTPILKTPALDKLHSQCVRLTDFHVSPMCTPTRSQLLTGVDALRNGAMNVSSGRTNLRREFPTLSEMLAAAGYRTGLFGKWHLGDSYPYRPQDRGFEKAIWFPSSHIPSAPDHHQNDYFDPYLRLETGKIQRFKGYCTDVYFREAMQWMAERAKAREPFLAYIPLNAAHGPLLVPEKYRAPFSNLPRPLASFYGMIVNIDENMAQLETFLTQQKLRDNTIVIFMTDNGGTVGVKTFNAGMRGKKIDLEEGGHRVPCFIRWPAGGLGEPRDVSELTVVQDITPTLLEWTGAAPPSGAKFDGVSLAGLLRGKPEVLADRMSVVQFSRMNAATPQKHDAAVLWKKWRLVRNAELYDVAADPGQEKNLITAQPEIAAKMRAHYEQWWASVEPRMNEFSPIIVGSEKENPLLLSPADWADVFLDQSSQVRAGLQRNGEWHIVVDREGTYEVELRRWPAESGLAIRAAAPAYQGGDCEFPAGKALPIRRAKLRVGSEELSRNVNEADRAAEFRLPLKAGRTTLQTWFYDEAGGEICGAYYVYVRRVR